MENTKKNPYEYQHDEYTAEFIRSRKDLPVNGIMVGGTNTEGRHGAGAALTMLQQFGARYGQGEGHMCNSYGIVTKELRMGYPRITLQQVQAGIEDFLAYASTHQDLIFYVTKIGTNLASFTMKEIGDLFRQLMPVMPINVILPIEFT